MPVAIPIARALSGVSLETVVEAVVTGPFATLVDLMARGPQQALIKQTIQNLRTRLENA